VHLPLITLSASDNLDINGDGSDIEEEDKEENVLAEDDGGTLSDSLIRDDALVGILAFEWSH
jgi:hypothetical protein